MGIDKLEPRQGSFDDLGMEGWKVGGEENGIVDETIVPLSKVPSGDEAQVIKPVRRKYLEEGQIGWNDKGQPVYSPEKPDYCQVPKLLRGKIGIGGYSKYRRNR